MVAQSSRQCASLCLLFLVLSTLVMVVGLALYRWYSIDDEIVGGLFTVCGYRRADGDFDDSCYSLNTEFRLPGVQSTSMPESWLAVQVLMGVSVFCIVIAHIANIVWIVRPLDRNMALVTAGFILLGGVFGVIGVIIFGVYWDDFINDFAFWLVVGAVCMVMLIGLVCLFLLLCMPHACGLCSCQGAHRKRVTVIRNTRKECNCSQPAAMPAPPCNCNNTTVVRPQLLALPAPPPAPAPAPAPPPPPAPAPIILPPPPAPQPPQTIIIQSPPTQTPIVTEPSDVRVNCNYNGGYTNNAVSHHGDACFCDSYSGAYGGDSCECGHHSAQIYVADSGCNCDQYY